MTPVPEKFGGMGRYGTALALLMYALLDASDALEPLMQSAVIVLLILLVMLAKYLAVTKGVKDEPLPPRE